MRKSFTWFLSFLVLLFVVANKGNAQEAQETVELYAQTATDCYKQANDYAVKISVRDFILLDSFNLVLDYNSSVFTMGTPTGKIAALSAMTITANEGTGGAGKITLAWKGTPTTIGDNTQTDIVTLKFSLKGFPGNSMLSYSTPLSWSTKKFYYLTTGNVQDEVNTVVSTNGSLKVDVSMTDITTQLTPETCAGGNATVTVTAPGATHYVFNEDPIVANWAWTTSNTYQAKAGQNVTVRVKNASGCISLVKIISIPTLINPVAYTVTGQNPTCYGGTGSVVVNATGGVAPYKYYINKSKTWIGAEMMNNFQFSQKTGSYYVAVQDANGCVNLADTTKWLPVTIVDNNTPITIDSVYSAITCNGGKTNVSFLIKEGTTAIGKTSQVSTDGGLTWGVVGDTIAENLAAGTYTVKVKTSKGCIISDYPLVITQPNAISIDLPLKIKDVSCGGLQNGVIYVTNIKGGTGPYKLEAKEGTTVTTKTGVLTAGDSLTGLKPVYYSLTITDANGCKYEYSNPNGSGNVIPVQSPADIKYTVTVTNPLCNNQDAKITVSGIIGGKGAYAIYFGGVKDADGIYNVAATAYTIPTISVANSDSTCVVPYNTSSVVITNPALITASLIDSIAPLCINSNDGNMTVKVKGGTKPYAYSVNNSVWKWMGATDSIAYIKVGVGTHTVKIKDKNECVLATPLTKTMTLDNNVITAAVAGANPCFGDKLAVINVSITSWAEGVPVTKRTLKYWVKDGAGNVTAFTPGTTTFAAGSYSVWATDQYTCESNKVTVNVTQGTELKIESVTANGASCYQSFDGTITIVASGGTLPSTAPTMLMYAVANNEAGIDNIKPENYLPFTSYNATTKVSTVSFKVDGGTYWIKVKDACKTLKSGPHTVVGYTQLLVDETKIVKKNATCNGTATASIEVPATAVTGGAGGYLYTLLNASSVEITGKIDQVTGLFAGLSAGTYKVKVEDANNCPSYTTQSIVLTQPEALTFTIDSLFMSCYNSNNGQVKVGAMGGTPNYSYAINNTNTWFPFEAGQSSKIYIATEAGVYNVWVKDANGCQVGPKKTTIKKPEQLSATITTTSVTCNGTSTGSATFTGKGGWAGMSVYNYKVDNGSWTSGTVNTVSGLKGGSHKVYIKDVASYSAPYQALTCIDSMTFTVNEPAPYVYDVVIANVKCKGGMDGTFTVNILSGGTPSKLNGYTVRLKGNAYDSGDKLTGKGGKTYTFTGLAKSFYTLTITDSLGCVLPVSVGDKTPPYSTEESWEVTEPAEVLTLEPKWLNDVSCNGGNDGKFELNAAGGSAPYKYYAMLSNPGAGHILVTPPVDAVWQDSKTFTVGAGTWVTWVKDANGCIKGGEMENGTPVVKYRVEVAQPAAIVWQFASPKYTAPKCNGEANGTINLNPAITGGTAAYTAKVTNSAGTVIVTQVVTTTGADAGKIKNIPAGFYTVTLMDSKMCTSSSKPDTVTVKQPAKLVVDLVKGDNQFTCANSNEGIIVANTTGGVTAYSWQLWKNGVLHTAWQSISNSFLVAIGNTYIVQAKDASGCMASDTIVINPVAPVKIASVKNISCYGDAKASARIKVTGEPGRKFQVSYREIETNGAWVLESTMFTDSIDLKQKFMFDTNSLNDMHYAFKVKDDKGCESTIDTITFDPVQNKLDVFFTNVVKAECSETAKLNVTGGSVPYVITLNNVVTVNSATVKLNSGMNTVKVTDSHYCVNTTTYEVKSVAVVRDTTVNTYIGEKVQFTDAEADVDTMLAKGNHTFNYKHTNGCNRVLNVKVVEVPKPYKISDVQGTGNASTLVGKVLQVSGTVTGIAAGEGFFVQDAVAERSGIWIEYSNVNALGLQIGNGVTVVGDVAEISSVTSINATSVVPKANPLTITGIKVTPTNAKAEKYESVLVFVEGARADEANTSGEWNIYLQPSDNVLVNDLMYAYKPVKGQYYDVTGVVNGRLDAFKIEPRMASDIVDLKATPIAPELTVEFKVYPNPFNNHIIIENNDKLTRLVISNIAGQRVIDVEYPENEIRTANLVSGVYVVSLYTEDGIVKTERMIKR